MPSAPISSPKLPIQPVVGSGPPTRDDERRVNLLVLCGLALIVGVMTGCGAVALRALIGLFHNLLYNGTFSIWYDANVSEGPSRFGDWVFLSPISAVSLSFFWCSVSPPRPRAMAFPR